MSHRSIEEAIHQKLSEEISMLPSDHNCRIEADGSKVTFESNSISLRLLCTVEYLNEPPDIQELHVEGVPNLSLNTEFENELENILKKSKSSKKLQLCRQFVVDKNKVITKMRRQGSTDLSSAQSSLTSIALVSTGKTNVHNEEAAENTHTKWMRQMGMPARIGAKWCGTKLVIFRNRPFMKKMAQRTGSKEKLTYYAYCEATGIINKSKESLDLRH